jgi:hypothetical protein
MNEKGALLLRPGTLVLFVFIAAFGFGVYSWASSSLNETREDSLEGQTDAIVCSNLEISEEGLQVSEEQVTLFFEVNRDVERVDLSFEGNETITKTIRLVQKDRIQSATVELSDFSSVSLRIPDCSRIFEFE